MPIVGGKMPGVENNMPRHDAFMSGLAGVGGGVLGNMTGLPFAGLAGSALAQQLMHMWQNRGSQPQFNLTPGDNSGNTIGNPQFNPATGTIGGGIFGQGAGGSPFGGLFSGGAPGGPTPGGMGGSYNLDPSGVGMYGPGIGGFLPGVGQNMPGGQTAPVGFPGGLGGGIPTGSIPSPSPSAGGGPQQGAAGGINAGRPLNQQWGLGPYNDLALNMSYNRYGQPPGMGGPSIGNLPPPQWVLGGYGGGLGSPMPANPFMQTMPISQQPQRMT